MKKLEVELFRVKLPNGQIKTMFVMPYSRGMKLPKPSTINKVLPKISDEYDKLIKSSSKLDENERKEALANFFKKVSKYAIIEGDFGSIIAKDLGLKKRTVLSIARKKTK